MKLESKEKTFKLIELMREEPVLCDVHSENYQNKDNKQTVEKRVVEELGVDGKQDGTTFCFNIRKNWRKLKTHHEIGVGSGDIYNAKLPFYSDLDSFLRPTLLPRATNFNLAIGQVINHHVI